MIDYSKVYSYADKFFKSHDVNCCEDIFQRDSLQMEALEYMFEIFKIINLEKVA